MTTHIPVPDSAKDGHWYLAKDSRGENLGTVFVRNYGDGVNVGVRVVGHQGCSFAGPLTESELGTYDAFNLFQQLQQVDAKKITIRITKQGQGGPTIRTPQENVQVAFKCPWEDYPVDGVPILSGKFVK